MFKNHPAMARRWAKHTKKGKKLPERVGTSMGSSRLLERIYRVFWRHSGPETLRKLRMVGKLGQVYTSPDGRRGAVLTTQYQRKAVQRLVPEARVLEGKYVPIDTGDERRPLRRTPTVVPRQSTAMARTPESDAEELRDELRAREDYVAKARTTGDERFREIADDERDHAKILRARMRGKTAAAAGGDSFVHQVAVEFHSGRSQREFEEQWLGKPGIKVLRRPGKVVVKVSGQRLSAIRDVMASALSAGGEVERRGALPRGERIQMARRATGSVDDPGLVHTVTRRRELWLRGAGTGAQMSSLTSTHPIHVRARFPGPADLVVAGGKLRQLLGKRGVVQRSGNRELEIHVTLPPRPPEIPRHVHNHGSFIRFLRDRIEALGGVVSGLVDSTVANSFALEYGFLCGSLTGWITPTGAHRPNAQHHHIENLTDILNRELKKEVSVGTDSFHGIKQGFAHLSHDGTQLFVTCMDGALQRVNTFLRRWVTKDRYPGLERIVTTVFNKRGEHRQTMRDVGLSHNVAFAYGPRVLEPVEDPVRNRRDIARVVAQQLRVTQTSAHPVIDRALAVIVDTLVKEGRVELRGFGVFKLVKKPQRWRNDPNRGNQPLLVPDRVTVVFTPSKLVLQRLHRPESVPGLKPLPLLHERNAPRGKSSNGRGHGAPGKEPFYGY